MKTLYTIAAAALLATAGSPALADHHAAGHAAHDMPANVVAIAAGSDQHETLVAAVQAAGLVDALSGDGPFTVFAPTDTAFAALPEGTLDTLLEPANRETLQAILTYHVVPGRVTAEALAETIRANGGSATIETLQGGTLTAELAGNGIAITDQRGGTATVLAADLSSGNGVVHVTDAVSLPN